MDHTRTSGKSSVSQEQQQQHLHILSQLMKMEGNNVCVDCSARRPRWASINLGVFICIRCSGIHRSLGVHISKVRSCTLDTWLPDQIEIMRRVGNVKANAFWEAKLNPGFRRPDENNDHEWQAFIRAKYESRRYASGEDPASLSTGTLVKSSSSPPPAPPSESYPRNLASDKVNVRGTGMFSDLQLHVQTSTDTQISNTGCEPNKESHWNLSTVIQPNVDISHVNSTTDHEILFSSLRDLEERVTPIPSSASRDIFPDPFLSGSYENVFSAHENNASAPTQRPNKVDSIMELFNEPKAGSSTPGYPSFLSSSNPISSEGNSRQATDPLNEYAGSLKPGLAVGHGAHVYSGTQNQISPSAPLPVSSSGSDHVSTLPKGHRAPEGALPLAPPTRSVLHTADPFRGLL